MMNFTPELVEKAKAATSAEELLELAKAAGVEMTAAEAATYFAQLNPKSGELDDDDLDAVAGGACQNVEDNPLIGKIVRVTSGQTCRNCGGNIGRIDIESAGFGLVLSVDCNNCSQGAREYTIDFLENCTYEVIG